MKRKILILWFVLLSFTVVAQDASDALRYSMHGFGGTSRYLGAAGAFGAIGADFSALSTNPAGIGLYRSSEVTFSSALTYSLSNATYNKMSSEDDKYNFNIGNAGVVFALGDDNNDLSRWKRVQFGFGFNRLADFHGNTIIEGDNRWNSIINEFQTKAMGHHPDNLHSFDTDLAWWTYLLADTIRNNNGVLTYTSAVPNGGVRQIKYIETRGSMNEMVLTLGGNYNDKLYLGATMGFPTISYKENSLYREVDTGDTIPGFNSLSIDDYLNTNGTGVNFKLGIIARPFNWVRIGAAIHTPTFFNMRDEYGRTISHYREELPVVEKSSPKGMFEYNLRTPMRAMVNLGFIIGNYGFIGVDYEFVDYSDAKLDSRRDKFSDVNRAVRDSYRATSNIRVGGELNLHPFRIRAGYALYGSPYADNINDVEKNSLTFGLGIVDNSYFIDFAFVMTSFNEDYYLYNPQNVNAANIEHKFSGMYMTLGYRF